MTDTLASNLSGWSSSGDYVPSPPQTSNNFIGVSMYTDANAQKQLDINQRATELHVLVVIQTHKVRRCICQ